jgi:hypothetical protein
MWGISSPAEQLSAIQEGLCYVDLVGIFMRMSFNVKAVYSKQHQYTF